MTSAYTGGSAPAVKFIDVRVLGRTGVGYTSDVLAGIDWAIANRTKYGIRVINLSLGHPVAEPAADRPAVHRGRARGQGRHRRRHLRRQLWPDVNRRPGSRRDYLPRKFACRDYRRRPRHQRHGRPRPTTWSRRTARAVRPAIDLAVKPDVVAPGTRIVSLEAAGSYLAQTYPQWHVAGTVTNGYLRLSGTSMATGVVSGGVALLLNARTVDDARRR